MVSRRAVLKTIGLVGLSAAAARTGLLPARAETSLQFPERWNGEPLARIAQAYQNARAEPHTDAPVVAELLRDEVVRVRRVVRGEQVFWNSDLWLETNRGYLYAAFVTRRSTRGPRTCGSSRKRSLRRSRRMCRLRRRCSG